jgi:hypothetical protein
LRTMREHRKTLVQGGANQEITHDRCGLRARARVR